MILRFYCSKTENIETKEVEFHFKAAKQKNFLIFKNLDDTVEHFKSLKLNATMWIRENGIFTGSVKSRINENQEVEVEYIEFDVESKKEVATETQEKVVETEKENAEQNNYKLSSSIEEEEKCPDCDCDLECSSLENNLERFYADDQEQVVEEKVESEQNDIFVAENCLKDTCYSKVEDCENCSCSESCDHSKLSDDEFNEFEESNFDEFHCPQCSENCSDEQQPENENVCGCSEEEEKEQNNFIEESVSNCDCDECDCDSGHKLHTCDLKEKHKHYIVKDAHSEFEVDEFEKNLNCDLSGFDGNLEIVLFDQENKDNWKHLLIKKRNSHCQCSMASNVLKKDKKCSQDCECSTCYCDESCQCLDSHQEVEDFSEYESHNSEVESFVVSLPEDSNVLEEEKEEESSTDFVDENLDPETEELEVYEQAECLECKILSENGDNYSHTHELHEIQCLKAEYLTNDDNQYLINVDEINEEQEFEFEEEEEEDTYLDDTYSDFVEEEIFDVVEEDFEQEELIDTEDESFPIYCAECEAMQSLEDSELLNGCEICDSLLRSEEPLEVEEEEKALNLDVQDSVLLYEEPTSCDHEHLLADEKIAYWNQFSQDEDETVEFLDVKAENDCEICNSYEDVDDELNCPCNEEWTIPSSQYIIENQVEEVETFDDNQELELVEEEHLHTEDEEHFNCPECLEIDEEIAKWSALIAEEEANLAANSTVDYLELSSDVEEIVEEELEAEVEPEVEAFDCQLCKEMDEEIVDDYCNGCHLLAQQDFVPNYDHSFHTSTLSFGGLCYKCGGNTIAIDATDANITVSGRVLGYNSPTPINPTAYSLVNRETNEEIPVEVLDISNLANTTTITVTKEEEPKSESIWTRTNWILWVTVWIALLFLIIAIIVYIFAI
ncbi:hypothetical protein [Mesomycoplasma lagogenitalium]|uniref:Uncharacterized protein n=1 Tax=Mesomycoplasma lagogenitalium TaxID=171286 RepID=A0ABY8LWL1_9BACT|nr:hypothetical protein [Mesomycoplasma lagogenitalium]WGI36811.1 hypothetical protein QEG99_00790 [Mesomycoplasma lagogenitalium]